MKQSVKMIVGNWKMNGLGSALVEAEAIGEAEALALQAACLLRMNHPNATAFIRSRIAREHGLALGTLPAEWVSVQAIEASFAV